jgi:hypothetical protein
MGASYDFEGRTALITGITGSVVLVDELVDGARPARDHPLGS